MRISKKTKCIKLMLSDRQMNLVKVICSLTKKIDLMPVSYQIFDSKGGAIHHCHIMIKEDDKRVNKLLKSLNSIK